MDIPAVASQMAAQARIIESLCRGIPSSQARWKPDETDWSMLEVAGHMLDEEQYDFRTRLDCILNHPGQPWPPIDPGGWVAGHAYNEQDLQETVRKFIEARQRSIAWLDTLGSPDLGSSGTAPWGGQVEAGDMLAAWISHDLLHMRQLVELRHAYSVELLKPYNGAYAGDW
ncbi:MAG: DinB family protein [Chloroflexi bacterium]|nr:DinB family protein [Chloroflexota bacterium]